MLRHEFRPGTCVAGLALTATAILFAGDAAGRWNTPAPVAIPLVCGGLGIAALVSWIDYGVRRRRRPARSASADSSGVPASTSGSQAIK
ncbi:hypothetical protein [Streptomyces sp. SDr-06]|uniref:hypothetical protein n=1 Tax=Streptomyces sp. SDr-06 TaxID=2267702 RepID=UPI000DE90A15|nr:hypothetical protein [Streptomyces sp. SDr-06]RCH68104.1 hypothetical protein DT019_14055 [Streptomyces sp. SDr-06]